jgi:hypothetical protein
LTFAYIPGTLRNSTCLVSLEKENISEENSFKTFYDSTRVVVYPREANLVVMKKNMMPNGPKDKRSWLPDHVYF